eukprot:m.136449 g.136449  ORF g.136449 m.136449 type:complete len:78 (-) comp20193_c0_seq6:1204-1437(-)
MKLLSNRLLLPDALSSFTCLVSKASSWSMSSTHGLQSLAFLNTLLRASSDSPIAECIVDSMKLNLGPDVRRSDENYI